MELDIPCQKHFYHRPTVRRYRGSLLKKRTQYRDMTVLTSSLLSNTAKKGSHLPLAFIGPGPTASPQCSSHCCFS